MTRTEQRLARESREHSQRAEDQKKRADKLEAAIKNHHRRVHAGDWNADDELWAAAGLEADAEVIG